MSIPNYSGFLSTFFSTTGTGTTGTDIMSTVGTSASTLYGTDGGVYNSGYMYIGNLLVQFTRLVIPADTTIPPALPLSPQTPITINYPKTFGTGGAYCILTNPSGVQTINQNYNVAVTASTTKSFNAETFGKNGYIQYIAIGPKP
jgi:hypothetical protein